MSVSNVIDNLSEQGRTAAKRLRPWKTAIVAIVVSLVGSSAVLGLHEYRKHLAWDDSYCVSPSQFRLVQATSWMTPEIAAEINASLLGLPPKLSIMDGESTQLVAAHLSRSPWVLRVDQVRLNPPKSKGASCGLDVALSFRRPVAFVEYGNGPAARYLLVDRDGMRLSGREYPTPVLGDKFLLTVSGVTTPPPAPGQVWTDPGVTAGAEVAEILRNRIAKFNLSRIDVSNVGSRLDTRRSEIVVCTKGGPGGQTRILWGGTASRKNEILEGMRPLDKLRCLDNAYAMLGNFDGPAYEIDIVERQVYRLNSVAPEQILVRG